MPPIAARDRLASAGVVIALLAMLALPGCSGLGAWCEDRARDVSDIVDVRYGTGIGLGVGVQLGEIFQTGLGCSIEWYQRQWFGRKSVEVKDGLFAGGVLIMFDGDYWQRLEPGEWIKMGNSTTGTFSILLLNVIGGPDAAVTGNEAWFTQPAGDPPLLTSLRVGGVVFLPAVSGGLYLNFGEFADFAAGLLGADPMHDDGLPKYGTASGTPEPSASQPDEPFPPAGL